jgi:serine/threonine-protein kinase HipA
VSARELAVYLDGVPVGTLRQDTNGKVSFGYDPGYVTDADAVPLSLSMPLTGSNPRPRVVNAFLAGLLPDSEPTLERWGRQYGVSARNPFALLRHVGMDAAGAVQIVPPEVTPTDATTRQGDIEWLTDADVRTMLTDVARHPRDWNPGRDTGRWSLAGAQGKVALFRDMDGRWGVPKDSTPTTHILKPSIPGYTHHHLNEHQSLRAAQLLGLPAARSEMLAGDDVEVLISHRYDRAPSPDGRWVRIHQEDMCQALGVHPSLKYQVDGGPGVAKIADLLRGFRRVQRQRSQARFFDYLVYNVSIGAPDAHAKNYSILLGRAGGVEIAPLYDVATLLPYGQERDARSAMKIGEHWETERITESDWESVGSRLGIDRNTAIERARELRAAIPKAFHDAATEAQVPEPLRDHAKRIADLVEAHVANRAARVPASPALARVVQAEQSFYDANTRTRREKKP